MPRPADLDEELRLDDGGERALPRPVLERRALRELQSIYREADALLARTSCPMSSQCCRLATTRREPYLLPVERLRLERGLAAQGRAAMPAAREDGACALLDGTGLRCSVYADRPFGCRTFFCERATGRSAPTSELHRLSARLTAASDALDPDGKPVAITALFSGGK